MIYTYRELKNKGLDNYHINKRVKSNELYKIENGLYSDTEKYNHLECFANGKNIFEIIHREVF